GRSGQKTRSATPRRDWPKASSRQPESSVASTAGKPSLSAKPSDPARFRARSLPFTIDFGEDRLLMEGTDGLDPLLDHLERTTPLRRAQAARVVADVLAFLSETTEQFVRRRHRELHARGVPNTAAFARIAAELQDRRVVAPDLSERQIRRLIYG